MLRPSEALPTPFPAGSLAWPAPQPNLSEEPSFSKIVCAYLLPMCPIAVPLPACTQPCLTRTWAPSPSGSSRRAAPRLTYTLNARPPACFFPPPACVWCWPAGGRPQLLAGLAFNRPCFYERPAGAFFVTPRPLAAIAQPACPNQIERSAVRTPRIRLAVPSLPNKLPRPSLSRSLFPLVRPRRGSE